VQPAVVESMTLIPLAIPLKREILAPEGALSVVTPVLLGVQLRGGAVGYQEIPLPPDTAGSAFREIEAALLEEYLPVLIEGGASNFPDALALLDSLPWLEDETAWSSALRSALEMALLAAVLTHFDRSLDDLVGWLGLAGFGTPGSANAVRYRAVIRETSAAAALTRMRWQYLQGVRNIKLPVAYAEGMDRVRQVAARWKGAIAADRLALHVTADGRWGKDEAIEWLGDARELPIASVEQPLRRGHEEETALLRDLFEVPIVLSASVRSAADLDHMLELDGADGIAISLAACGGLVPALRLAEAARNAEVPIEYLGDVTDTSLGTAAGLAFLQVCPGIAWAEGAAGTRLLGGDVIRRSLQYRRGGRLPNFEPGSLAVDIKEERLARMSPEPPVCIRLG
jgi:L-alanine-DL-glutamate epimerase-like enolase superfamily enzyme